jgi:hypothetical protein
MQEVLGQAAHAKLYRLVILDQVMHAKLYRTIRSRGFAHIVTDFRIHFEPCSHLRQSKRILQRCTCDRFDVMLGQVMLSLQNLQVLHFKCLSCPTEHSRHRYLTELPTQRLQKAIFRCYCMSELLSNTYQMLASPCMAPILSLYLFDVTKPGNCDVLSSKSSLPHLKKLICYDIELVEAVLPKRTITHLSVLSAVGFGWLHNIISRISCSLTYLQVLQTGDTILYFIAMDSSPYRSLKHLGSLDFGKVRVRDFSESL